MSAPDRRRLRRPLEARPRRRLDLIKVNYEILPFVVDLDEARQPDAPRVFEANWQIQKPLLLTAKPESQPANVFGPTANTFFGDGRGDVTEGFRASGRRRRR